MSWTPTLYAPAPDATIDPNPGRGPYEDDDVSDEFYWAAAELYLTTGEKGYRTNVLASPHHSGRSSVTTPSTGNRPPGWRGSTSPPCRASYRTPRRCVHRSSLRPTTTCARKLGSSSGRPTTRKTATGSREAEGDFSWQSGRAGALDIMSRWPETDGLFAAADTAATGVLAGLTALGVRVPGQVRVVGFDDSPLSRASHPQLSTIHQLIAELGAHAGLRLLGALGVLGAEGSLTSTSEPARLLPVHLMARAST